MPPKKSKAKQTKAKVPSNDDSKVSKKATTEDQESTVTARDKKPTDDAPSTLSSKRKAKSAPSSEPRKAPRRSGRRAPETSVDPVKMLRYLVSDAAVDLCRPKDELEELSKTRKLKTYSSMDLNPFEELVCAVVLSRPISHRLGLRTIRTIFNAPYEFNTPQAIRDAGKEKRHQALWDARTQHKDKTAEEIGALADVVAERFVESEEDTTLGKLREDAGNDVGKERDMLKTHIKGLGKTGLDIFFRRVQALWAEAYPFADQRTLSATEKLGLPSSAEDLRGLIEGNWTELDHDSRDEVEEDDEKRRVFAHILEIAVGIDLEGNVDTAKDEAAKETATDD